MKRIAVFLIVLIGISLVFACIPTQNPKEVNLESKFLPMSGEHILGTDDLGRDIFALMINGFNRTLYVVISAMMISLIIGVGMGTCSGYFGGKIRVIVRGISDLCMIVPSFIIALIVAAFMGYSPVSIGIALGIYGIGKFAYQSEALTRTVVNEEFIKAEKLMGTSSLKIILYHVIPQNLSAVMAVFASQGAGVVVSYAALTFIGLGSDITTPDWGSMLYQYRFYIVQKPQLLLWPTMGILALSIGIYAIFDNLGDKKVKGSVI